MKYVDCKKYAQEILDKVKAAPYKKRLTIITVGEDEASKSYVKGKMKDCEYCGIPVRHIKIEDNKDAVDELNLSIQMNNNNFHVGGIIVQLPLPKWMGDSKQYTNLIAPEKDVDGLREDSPFTPCTPKGIMYLLEKELGDLAGKSALVIGRSDLVGKPLAKMLLDADCTVTLAHSKSNYDDIDIIAQWAEIIVSAVGKAELLHLSRCKCAEMVVDVGINRNENGKLCGDVYGFKDGIRPFLKLTPVPGGVGLLTRAMLMQNMLEASTQIDDWKQHLMRTFLGGRE